MANNKKINNDNFETFNPMKDSKVSINNSNENIEVSRIGEIINNNSFYSYDAKYISKNKTVDRKSVV